MLSDISPAAAPSTPDAISHRPYPDYGRGRWVKNSMARVRAALVERQMQPLSRAEWVELRGSLAPIRPLPPQQVFRPAKNLFRD